MIITYVCKNCGSKRFLSKVEENVLCKKCSSVMEIPRSEINSDSITTQEARFIADEALYNTVGSRMLGYHSSR